jgi:LacI family transcriptional regulator
VAHKHRLLHVAVLIESSRAYGRGLIEGVAQFAREHDDWRVYFEPRGLEPAPPWLERWTGDGIMARLPTKESAQVVASRGIPVVELYATARPGAEPMVGAKNEGIARLAFEHLHGLGLRQFGVCGLPVEESPYIAQRGQVFHDLAESAGCPCSIFPAEGSRLEVTNWEWEQNRIAAWLLTLQTPVGIVASFDERGFQILNACTQAGLKVPEDVALLSVGNDALLCEMAVPPLSSIDLNAPRIGYEAAGLLDRWMRGAAKDSPPIRIEPQGLVARRSTDLIAVEDPDVAAALLFIRENACQGIRVQDVVRQVGVSVSVLERKFRKFFGRTPKAELIRVQVTRAKQLLAESELAMVEVAEKSGFSGEKYFSDAFFRLTGSRPGAYRRDQRQSRFRTTE